MVNNNIKNFLFILLISCNALGQADIMDSIEMMISANAVNSERMNIATENIANQNSVSQTPGGDPYYKKALLVKQVKKKNGPNLLKVAKIVRTKKNIGFKYDPSHPGADPSNGIVKTPNVNVFIEKADFNNAENAYLMNLSIISSAKNIMGYISNAMK